MKFTTAPDEAVPVLIVGGGGAGLTASMLLARQGAEHLLVSARPRTSDLPKAHVLNLRAMEVLEDVGAAAAVAERGTPAGQMAATAYYAGFAGPDPDYGRRLARLESWGAGGEDEFWRAASPCRHDPRCAWVRHRGIQSDGAVLVRPDRCIAWPAPTAAENPLAELAGVFGEILGRPVVIRPVPVGLAVTS